MKYEKYETKPLDCWQKSKELRAQYWREVTEAKEKGKLLGAGFANLSTCLPGIFDNCEFIDLGSYSAVIAASEPDLAKKCFNSVAGRGYSADICHAVQIILGSMFLDRSHLGSFFKPDFYLQVNFCESQGKGAQVLAEYLGIPYFCIDLPIVPPESRKDSHLNYLVSQLEEAIEWLEKVTGKKCDDTKLIEGVNNEIEAATLWSRTYDLNKSIPAPVSAMTLSSLCLPLTMKKHSSQTVKLYRMMYDEVKDRVKNHIAALATERCRLLHEGIAPWPFTAIVKYPEDYGALFVCIAGDFILGRFCRQADGSLTVAKTPQEQGITINSRETALRCLAEEWLDNAIISGLRLTNRAEEVVRRALDWHIGGVAFHCDHGCQLFPAGMPEARLALKGKNIPSIVYEASSANPQDIDQLGIISQFETFLETLGLTPIATH